MDPMNIGSKKYGRGSNPDLIGIKGSKAFKIL
jgi:hypothetical protein